MKKRRRSEDVLHRRAEKKFLRNARNPRKFNFYETRAGVQRLAKSDWSIASQIKRWIGKGFNPIKFPEEMDIFGDVKQWSKTFNELAFPQGNEVYLDMSRSKFFYPEFFVYLAAVSEHLLAKSNCKIQTQKENHGSLDSEFNKYLRACGLRDFFFIEKSKEDELKRDPEISFGDCVPISRDDGDRSSVSYKFAELMEPYLENVPGHSTHALGEALGEVMGNSLEHGVVPAWFRIGQIHNDRRAISLAIADNGVGVPYTLRAGHDNKRFTGMTDSMILKESFRYDVTSFAPKKGQAHGQGLNIVYEKARTLKGKVALLSGSGLYRKDFETGEEFFDDFEFNLPGTLLVLRLSF